MSGRTRARLATLEKASFPDPEHHLLVWGLRESFDEMLDHYGRDSIRQGDEVTVLETTVWQKANPIHDRDRPKLEAWLAWVKEGIE